MIVASITLNGRLRRVLEFTPGEVERTDAHGEKITRWELTAVFEGDRRQEFYRTGTKDLLEFLYHKRLVRGLGVLVDAGVTDKQRTIVRWRGLKDLRRV
jgi:hypothetical protein